MSVSSQTQAVAGEIARTAFPAGRVCDARGPSRTRLLESSIATVEDLRGPVSRVRRSPESFSADFQVCLPYRGLFVWHVADDDVVGDANQVLFVSGGESFYLSQPYATDYAELIITPDVEVLAELAHRGGPLTAHPFFRRRCRRVDPRLQYLRTRFLHHAVCGAWNGLGADDCVLTLLRLALDADAGAFEAGRRTRRLVSRTKEFLEAHLADSIRLIDVARAVGASPAYLTDVFRRVEGVPLHGYLMQLRLARALVELPHTSDLTTLALALGFASHSHFTVVFRRAFACTPSQFRESTRDPRRLAGRVNGHGAAC